VVYDELLTLLSILCQRCFKCANGVVLHFIRYHQVYFLQAVALRSLKWCAVVNLSGMEEGMQQSTPSAGRKRVIFGSSSARR
jgi:hypothetical protein